MMKCGIFAAIWRFQWVLIRLDLCIDYNVFLLSERVKQCTKRYEQKIGKQ